MKPRHVLLIGCLACSGLVYASYKRRSNVAPPVPQAPPISRARETRPTSVAPQPRPADPSAMYTTYFYTAAEAIIHGYEKNTRVRIVSNAKRSTIWQGVVDEGQTRLIPTGPGVFTFLSDKKASVLAGTPSSCVAVGYFVRDRDGTYVSDLLYTQLPSGTTGDDARLLVWAWQDLQLTITDSTADTTLFKGSLKAGHFHELGNTTLTPLRDHVLRFRADKRAMAVQLYYDEGFIVPASDGRGVGREFLTYVGSITEGKNDLNVISYGADAQVKATDIKNGETIWTGTVRAGTMKTLTLVKRYVKVSADHDVAVSVIPFEHYHGNYAEHHYSVGAEGSGIDHDFLLPTPEQVWVFSYYDQNLVRVTDTGSGKEIWKGTLMAGQAHGLRPGHGLYRVRSTMGASVMGGSEACGGDYSPAAGMFRVDEEVLRVTEQIIQERRIQAAATGRTLSDAEASAPLTATEGYRAQAHLRGKLKQTLSVDEVNARLQAQRRHK
jgi:hypothetical protein